MTNAKKAQVIALLADLLGVDLGHQPKAPTFKAKSTYRAANKYTPKGKIGSDGRTDRQLRNDVNVAKAFKKKGFDVTPRVDALTYKGWLSKGQRVMAGQHGLFVKGVGTLFHSGQVAPDMPINLVTGQPVVQAIA